MIPESQHEPPDLEACQGEYWREGPRLSDLRDMPPSAHAPQALLRRLGPSELNGKFPLVGLLASIYDHVRDHAVRLRDRAEGIDENGGRISSRSISEADPRPPP